MTGRMDTGRKKRLGALPLPTGGTRFHQRSIKARSLSFTAGPSGVQPLRCTAAGQRHPSSSL